MSTSPRNASTGIRGLDSILHGGLPCSEMHLVQGATGTGKTTVGLQFLLEGVKQGERVLYVTLSQSRTHLERIAESHGWSVDGVDIHELSPGTLAERLAARQTVLPTAELELEELLRDLHETVARVKPRRAVLDSLSVLELLSATPQRYHRDVVTLRQLFVQQDCTLLAIADEPISGQRSSAVLFQPLAGCVIELTQKPQSFGSTRFQARIVKARAMPVNSGLHDYKIKTGGMHVYPRLGAYREGERKDYRPIKSGVDKLDTICGGGIETGSSCLIVGAAGVGKSTPATLYAVTIAETGGRAAIFLFDERPQTYLRRSDLRQIPLRRHVEAGTVLLEQVDPGETAPGEFAQRVRALVDEGVKLVVIDSMVGYFAAMGAANVLVTQLHELMTYLTRSDVAVIMCGAQLGFTSIGPQESVDVSYLSDTVISLTFFEEDAALRRAIAIAKKKTGTHLIDVFEIFLDEGKVRVSEQPLRGHKGLMLRSESSDG